MDARTEPDTPGTREASAHGEPGVSSFSSDQPVLCRPDPDDGDLIPTTDQLWADQVSYIEA